MHNSPIVDLGPLREMRVMGDASQGKIALVDVDGLLLNSPAAGFGAMGENPVSVFREKLDRIAADPCCRAVVLRINSPGGGVTASDIMWRDLQAFRSRSRLPVVACLLDVGAGGAYYLALAADHVMAHPTTVVGGVGVIFNLYNLEEAMLQFNVLAGPIKAGRHIDLGSPIQPLDDESAAILQGIADQYHTRFCELVRQARPEFDPNGDEVLDGRVLLADKALQRRLIDSIGYLDDAIAEARRLANAPRAGVVMLHRCADRARSPYAVSPNTPVQGGLLPFSIPGLERAQLPTFLYLWQPEPTLERRASGR
jgi:protease-4